jgi:DNA adenine methylase
MEGLLSRYMTQDYLSPLRYPGAKRKIAPYVETLIQDYGLQGSVFVEPCCGGASVSLHLLERGIVSNVILIDKDPWVASFWQILFSEPDQLIEDIMNVEVSVAQWRTFKETEPQNMREMALYCFFFNRTNYSGILNGGMIGGHGQKSQYKINCRFNKSDLIKRIRRLSERFSNRILAVREASIFEILEEAKAEHHDGRIYYIDPPYVDKGQTLYHHNFRTEDHQSLKTCLEDFHEPWILSYHEHNLVEEMYLKGELFESQAIDAIWVAQRATLGKELLIHNLPSIRARQEPLLWRTTLNEVNNLGNEEFILE